MLSASSDSAGTTPVSEPDVHLLFPSFEIGVSLNGHLSEFLLGPGAYAELSNNDEEIDPFNYVEVWAYFDRHVHRYLMDVVDHTGPIDADNVRLVTLVIHLVAGPADVTGVIDCENCLEGYQEELDVYFSGYKKDESDDD